MLAVSDSSDMEEYKIRFGEKNKRKITVSIPVPQTVSYN